MAYFFIIVEQYSHFSSTFSVFGVKCLNVLHVHLCRFRGYYRVRGKVPQYFARASLSVQGIGDLSAHQYN